MKLIINSSPGHGISLLQDCVSVLFPGQRNPRNAGGGLVQVRYRICVPPPHVCEHLPQAFQAAQFPSTIQVAKRTQSERIAFAVYSTVDAEFIFTLWINFLETDIINQ